MTIFKADNTGAFGKNFITINLVNPYEFEISKAIFRCCCITREWVNPQFPIVINFNEDETKHFDFKNVCYLAVYDSMGRKKTCKGKLTFKAENEVV